MQRKYWKMLVSRSSLGHELCHRGPEVWTGIYLVARQLAKTDCGVPWNHPVKAVLPGALPEPSLHDTQGMLNRYFVV